MSIRASEQPVTPDRGRSAHPPEIELLLCCARRRLTADEVARIETLLQGGVSWDRLIAHAARHRLLPLLYRHLSTDFAEHLPPQACDAMQQRIGGNIQHSLLLTAELRGVLRLLQDNGIAAVAYKGPLLAEHLYGDVGLRAMGDLDILVPRADVVGARDLLHARGYRAEVPMSERQKASVLRSDSNYPLVHDRTGVVVELHWTPEATLSARNLEQLWQRLEHLSLGGVQVPSFSGPDLLVLLSMHGNRHMWERLEWIAGVAELVRTSDFVWTDVLELASSLGGRRALHVSLLLIQDLLTAPVPDDVMRLARADRRAEQLAATARAHLFRETPILAHRLGLPFHLFQLRSMERSRDRIRYLQRRALAPAKEDWAAVPLPSWLFPAYVVARPFRITWQYATRTVRRASSPRTISS